MTYGIGPANSQSAYLPPEVDFPEDPKQFQDVISQRERLTATILNTKEGGNYEKSEILSGQQWFSTTGPLAAKMNRYGFRFVMDAVAVNNAAIPNGTTTSLRHNLTGITIPLHIFGSATVSGPIYLPLPYPSVSGADIEINIDGTNININNNFGSSLTQCYIVFEYLKQ